MLDETEKGTKLHIFNMKLPFPAAILKITFQKILNF